MEPRPPTFKITKDAQGRIVWQYRIFLNDRKRPMLELVLHEDYRPHAYPFRDFWMWDDGTQIPAKASDIERYWPKE